MKKYYEIALMQHVHGSVDDDYETTEFVTTYKGYRADKRLAKEYSKHIGERVVDGIAFPAREKEQYVQPLDEGLAAVKIVCYTETEYTSYEPLYYEYYKDGKVDYKIDFTLPEWMI